MSDCWYVISVYEDDGEYEVLFEGKALFARAYFLAHLETERSMTDCGIRHQTDFQFEVWITDPNQQEAKPNLAYTVKLTTTLPSKSLH